jgi:hypothetical protein
MGFMDAAWQSAVWRQRGAADYLSLTQSQYSHGVHGWVLFFSVVRSLPINSGHGGYHDWGRDISIRRNAEYSRARDFTKPNWYLPCWYGKRPPINFGSNSTSRL